MIVAVDDDHGIGKTNDMAWRNKDDMAFFRKTTMQSSDQNTLPNLLIMGRNTWNSIGKALPGRMSMVITRDKTLTIADPNVVVVHSVDDAIHWVQKNVDRIHIPFVIGGGQIYTQFLARPGLIKTLYVTTIPGTHQCDVFFPTELPPTTGCETLDFRSLNILKFEFQ